MATRDTVDDSQFSSMSARLLRREALRRAAEELNTTSGPGLEGVLARISAEVTAEAVSRQSPDSEAAKPVSSETPDTKRLPPI